MPHAEGNGARLYYEEAGSGVPIVFVHEFYGDLWSWEMQIQHFSRRYRCVAFNARGFPPSDVPAALSRYSPHGVVADLRAVMQHLGIGKAHVMGCSMGARTTLDFGLSFPRMALSLTVIAIGAGSDRAAKRASRQETEAKARVFEEDGLAAALKAVRVAPNRVQLKRKNPRAWDEFCRRYMLHSAQGFANTSRRVWGRRPSVWSLEGKLRALKVPVHAIVGDEDPGPLEASLFIKRVCPAARLTVVPASGHVVNLEEPDLVNSLTDEFYALVESRHWRPRKL